MNRLSVEAWKRASEYLDRQARPLDRALFSHATRGGSPDAVLRALDAFQNDDGGYGHSLEPDLRLPASSVIATICGLGFLREIDAPADEPRVRRALAWLVRAFDPEIDGWRMVPPEVDAHPHANHWNWSEHIKGWSETHVNPGALILVFFHTWPELAPAGEAKRLGAELPARFASCEPGADGLLSAAALLEARECPEPLRATLLPLVQERARAILDRDPAHWTSYVPNPLKLAPAPDALLGPLLRDDVQPNLDWLIAQQAADGSWTPNWTWRGAYPDAWPVAEREWRGVVTRENLAKLRTWGRLDDAAR